VTAINGSDNDNMEDKADIFGATLSPVSLNSPNIAHESKHLSYGVSQKMYVLNVNQ